MTARIIILHYNPFSTTQAVTNRQNNLHKLASQDINYVLNNLLKPLRAGNSNISLFK